MKKFVRKITASTDNLAYKVGELQSASNELVDAILELEDNMPTIIRNIAQYDRDNAEYGESIANELPEQIDWAIKQIKDVINDVKNISDYFIH